MSQSVQVMSWISGRRIDIGGYSDDVKSRHDAERLHNNRDAVFEKGGWEFSSVLFMHSVKDADLSNILHQ